MNAKIRPNQPSGNPFNKRIDTIKLDPQLSDMKNFSFNCQGKLKYYGTNPKYWGMSAYNPETYNK